jgi:hypothetical protein
MKTPSSQKIVYALHAVRYFSFFLLLSSGTAQAATTWYVKSGGTGSGNGSWGAAAPSAQLATIIAGAASGDQVWVAAGTYYPTTGASRTAAFTLKSGVLVYGGFNGTETTLGARNWITNVTILSGDIGVAGVNTDNSYNVVVSTGNTAGTTLDGFTIEKGNANGAGQDGMGGGIYNSATTVTYSNCTITNNTAIGGGTGTGGGGAYATGSGTVTFSNCSFSSNSTSVAASTATGGGGFFLNGGVATLSGCIFSGNTSSSEGGGILNTQSGNLTLSSCAFTGNVATGSGGGLATYSAASYLTGCVFTSNISNSLSTGGGGVYTNTGTGTQLTSCVFTGNSAHEYGGGFYDNGGDALGVTRCIFTSNSATDGGGVATNNGTSPAISNCRFSNNVAQVSGGGIYNNNAGNGSLVTDTFFNNTANDADYATSPVAGGGVCNVNASNIALVHCFLQGNVASEGDGGGEYNLNNSTSNDSSDIFMANQANNGNGGGLVDSSGNPKFYKCVFADNQCAQYGGGVYTANNNGSLESITFFNNKANTSGGYGDGIYVNSGNIKIYGNMIWSRTSSSIGLVTSAAAAGSAKVDYNDIIGVLYTANGGAGNISTAPGFGNSGNYTGTDGLWETADDGLHLVVSSAGTDAVPSGFYFNVTDITEAVRPDGGGTMADMGAYESPGTFTSLAVQLLRFTAAPAGSSVVNLAWEADAASQAVQYQVQKSVNGTDFSSIGTVDAAVGQTNYQFADQNAAGSLIYYRLLLIQADRSVGYSATVTVQRTQPAGQASLRPSVIGQGATTLYIGSPVAGSVNVTITDGSGSILTKKSVTVNAGDNYISLDVPGFAKGVYYVYITGEGGWRKTLTLERL